MIGGTASRTAWERLDASVRVTSWPRNGATSSRSPAAILRPIERVRSAHLDHATTGFTPSRKPNKTNRFRNSTMRFLSSCHSLREIQDTFSRALKGTPTPILFRPSNLGLLNSSRSMKALLPRLTEEREVALQQSTPSPDPTSSVPPSRQPQPVETE